MRILSGTWLVLVLVVAASSRLWACESPTPGLLVSPAGTDTGDGSSARPFRTLDRAHRAMRAGEARTTYVDGGVYALTAPLHLGAEDSFSSFLACPGQMPALDGGAAGLETLFDITDATGVTIQGLTFAHATGPALILRGGSRTHIDRNLFTDNGTGILSIAGSHHRLCANRVLQSARSGIEVKDGSEKILIAHNTMDGTGAPTTHGGGVFVHGSLDSTIVRNRVRNTRGMGIGVANWDADTINRGTLIVGNALHATNRHAEDSGAIYVLGRSHVDQRSRIAGNLIDDFGAPGDAHTIGIYLDDSSSGIVVEGNIIRSPGTHAVQIHGGDDVSIRHNVFDLGKDATSAILFQAAPLDTNPTNTMRNNRVSRNVILATGLERAPYTFIEGDTPSIADNLLIRPADWVVPPASDLVASASEPASGHSEAAALAAQLIDFPPIETSAIGPDPAVDCARLSHADNAQ